MTYFYEWKKSSNARNHIFVSSGSGSFQFYEIKIEIVARIINPLLLGDKYLTQLRCIVKHTLLSSHSAVWTPEVHVWNWRALSVTSQCRVIAEKRWAVVSLLKHSRSTLKTSGTRLLHQNYNLRNQNLQKTHLVLFSPHFLCNNFF